MNGFARQSTFRSPYISSINAGSSSSSSSSSSGNGNNGNAALRYTDGTDDKGGFFGGVGGGAAKKGRRKKGGGGGGGGRLGVVALAITDPALWRLTPAGQPYTWSPRLLTALRNVFKLPSFRPLQVRRRF
jgi:hypothetical protein